jgi:hypothetical protein
VIKMKIYNKIRKINNLLQKLNSLNNLPKIMINKNKIATAFFHPKINLKWINNKINKTNLIQFKTIIHYHYIVINIIIMMIDFKLIYFINNQLTISYKFNIIHLKNNSRKKNYFFFVINIFNQILIINYF